jgi:hypothetical protein
LYEFLKREDALQTEMQEGENVCHLCVPYKNNSFSKLARGYFKNLHKKILNDTLYRKT